MVEKYHLRLLIESAKNYSASLALISAKNNVVSFNNFLLHVKDQNFLCTLIFLSEGVRINVGRFYQNQLRAF